MDDLCNIDGVIKISRNSDGGLSSQSSDWGGKFHID